MNRTIPRATASIVCAAAAAFTFGVGGAAAVSDSDVGVKKRDSVPCTAPKGNKVNYSWEKGANSATVYFNNHCSHKVNGKLAIAQADGAWRYDCLGTNGGTKGKKKFHVGAGEDLKKITRGC